MDDARERPSVGQVLAGAVAAAGATAGIAVGLGRIRSTQRFSPAVEGSMSSPLAESAGASAAAIGQLAEVLGHEVKERAETAARAAPDRARAASHRIQQEGSRLAEAVPGELERIEAAVTTEAKRFGRRARRATRRGSEKGRDVAAASVDRTKRRAERLGKETTSTSRQVASQAAAAAIAQVERLLGSGDAVGEANRRGWVKASRSSRNDRAEVAPAWREVADRAVAAALDFWQGSRETAREAAGTAEAGLGRSTKKASRVVAAQGDRVRSASGAAAERAADRAAEVGDLAAQARDRARGTGQRAVEATADAGKDTGATLFWLAAAAGLVFYGLLDAGKRERTIHVARTATTQLQELIRDFRGYDDEF